MKIPFLDKIPGFRSGNIFKAVIATTFYIFVAFFIFAFSLTPIASEPKAALNTSLSEETSAPAVTQETSEIPTTPTPTPTPTTVAQTAKYKVLSVTDGDTVRIEYNGVSTPLRLIGIDTPETRHPSEPVHCYGPEASNKTTQLLLGKYVELETDVTDTDKYDRLLRYIWLDGTLINELLVRQGYAISSRYPPDIKYQARLDAAQALAQMEMVGFWSQSTCSGDFYTGTYLDPNKVVEIVPVVTTSGSYSCSCSKTCKQMASCEEAYYQLQSCGCSARDGDKDGVPCESICN